MTTAHPDLDALEHAAATLKGKAHRTTSAELMGAAETVAGMLPALIAELRAAREGREALRAWGEARREWHAGHTPQRMVDVYVAEQAAKNLADRFAARQAAPASTAACPPNCSCGFCLADH